MALLKRNKGAVERFEKAFARQFQAVDAIAFPYGRSAQWAFFKAIGIEGSEIIMPAYTCSVVAHAVVLSGNTPVFIDINLEDYNMNLEMVADAITPKTQVIIATNTFGYPQDVEHLEAIVKEAEERYGKKIWLMQDCCHAFGAEWKGRMVGASGDVAVYAFNISKIMTSIFGGMLTFQDQRLAATVRAWRDAHYRDANLWKGIRRRLYLLAVYAAFINWIYGLTWWLAEKTPLLNRWTRSYHLDERIRFPPDYRDKMLDLEAAVGLAQLKKYSEIIAYRRKKVLWYDQNLRGRHGWVLPPIVEGATYSHYVVSVPDRGDVKREYAQKGIEVGEVIQYYIPGMSCYEGLVDAVYPNARKASLGVVNFRVTK